MMFFFAPYASPGSPMTIDTLLFRCCRFMNLHYFLQNFIDFDRFSLYFYRLALIWRSQGGEDVGSVGSVSAPYTPPRPPKTTDTLLSSRSCDQNVQRVLLYCEYHTLMGATTYDNSQETDRPSFGLVVRYTATKLQPLLQRQIDGVPGCSRPPLRHVAVIRPRSFG